ncbi:MAG: DUF5060 domain-containing protein [Prevotellaceae bacterium]|nr:DUF5060 domain-containing protein [Prevotellaceae bacterium]
MKTRLLLLAFAMTILNAAAQVERWGMFEVSLSAPLTDENPFDTELKATFNCNGTSMTVSGFYDGASAKKGEGIWRIRFMPTVEGTWTYVTSSTVASLNDKKGEFTCTKPSSNNHGPVMVDKSRMNFCYADGTRYYPIGTTSYDWMHASNDPKFGCFDKGLTIQEQTMKSLKESGFNKVRSLFLVHNFDASYPEPDIYPFERKGDSWDWERLNPRYFDHVEACTRMLMNAGIEQDLIIFHPYDDGRWGFDLMPREAGERMCKYIVARLGAFRNVWWSMANEYDFLKAQFNNWDAWTDAVVNADSYHHLISIHSGTARYYKYWDERYTHCSIQDQAPVEIAGGGAIVRNIYKKPVIFDEVCYEGDMTDRWGNLSGQEELYRMWTALMCGTYASHAECFQFGNPHDFSRDFLAVGGKWQGESWKRIKFMRSILDEMPSPLYLPDSSWDIHTSACGKGWYMVYLGHEIIDEWTFELPMRNVGMIPRLKEGQKFTVEIIDTWNMTITKCPQTFVTKIKDRYRVTDINGGKVSLPKLPYLLLRIKMCSENNRCRS